MLDRTKVLKELVAASSSLFADYAQEQAQARIIWQALCSNTQLQQDIQDQEWPFLVPKWADKLCEQHSIDPNLSEYTVFAVDGSQIYPDRHQGMACYLLNVGTAFFRYGSQSRAKFRSEPTIKVGYDGDQASAQEVLADVVNCQRTELELQTGVDIVKKLKDPGLFLFDGSLIFWHLDSKETVVRNQFLTSYLGLLEQLYQQKALHAGYISLPKSRELVNILRACTTNLRWVKKLTHPHISSDTSERSEDVLYRETATTQNLSIQRLPAPLEVCGEYGFNSLVDSDIAHFFLEPNHRTIVFKNQSPIVKYYPDHLKPHFFYLNNGTEIVRIEIPAWIAADGDLVEKIAQIVLNQCLKGRGYPICLAEAHEQAVVKGADREFFYHILHKYALERGQKYQFSQKSVQKRGVGI